MKTRMILAMAVVLASAGWALGGYDARTASGTTEAAVAWPGGSSPVRLVTLDAGTDLETAVATWRRGTLGTEVAVAAASTETNVTCLSSALASNDVVLLQNGSGLVTQAVVWGRAAATNATLALDYALGTNMAVGDRVLKVDPAYYTLQYQAASNATVLFVDRTNYLTASTNLIVDYGSWVWKTDITNRGSDESYAVMLTKGLEADMAVAADVYPLTAKATNILGVTAYDGTSLHVKGTDGFVAPGFVLVETAKGLLSVKQIDSVSTTNVTLADAVGVAVDSGARIYPLGAGQTVMKPSLLGEKVLHLSATNSAGATLVCRPVSGPPWRVKTAAAAELGATCTVTLAEGLADYCAAGTRIYLLTNRYTLLRAQGAADKTVTVAASTGLAAGDQVAILPATGGAKLNRYRAAAAEVMNTLTLTEAAGIALAAGDKIFATTAMTAVLGATNVHWTGEALFSGPAKVPVRLGVDGTSECAIGNAVLAR